jgi:hypothetical protein
MTAAVKPIVACGLAGLTLFGSGIARADASQEQEACQLNGRSGGARLGLRASRIRIHDVARKDVG